MKKVINPGQTFVRIYRMPPNLTNGYCMPHPVPIQFSNVDWFNVHNDTPREEFIDFVKHRRYYTATHDFLVIGDTPEWTFIIEGEYSTICY